MDPISIPVVVPGLEFQLLYSLAVGPQADLITSLQFNFLMYIQAKQ
jgi:hypothetical protein